MSHKTKNQDTREDYGLLGMLLGLTIGMATGKFLLGSGSMGMSIGMLAGLILGSFIHKEKQEEEK